ncbi:MAG: sigma-54-dependent Fis family transcriptional regulator [Comamonas sp.]
MSERPALSHSTTLAQSHQRSLAFGLSAHCAPEPEALTRQAMDELLASNRVLHTHARPVMEALREQIAGTDSMVLLTDRHGTILHALGDDDFLARASRVALRPGIAWSERARGTNAIGTALVEGDAVQVHAGEHYLHANHVLTCSCAPIHDPLGRIIGALDVSGDHRQPHGHTLALVRMSAQMVENHLFLNSHAQDLLLHFHARAEFVGTLVEGLAAFTPDGRFLSANRSGQFQLGLPLRALEAHTFSSLFGTGTADVLAHVHRHGQALLRLRLYNGMSVLARAQFDRPMLIGSLPAAGLSAADGPVPNAGTAAAPGKPFATTTAPLAPSTAGREARTLDDLLATREPHIAQAIQRARKALPHRSISILIQGETGTGKEVFAKALHLESERCRGPFVALNCAAIPETLIESELFGYEEGAFTGARRKGHAGKVQQADGGTLFLDEIGDMPLPMQGRLLRVLQEQVVTPLGGTRDIAVDVRIVSATHRHLPDLIARGLFREDLYYRLNGLAVRMPPLREREDLADLIDQLWREQWRPSGCAPPRFDADVRAALLAHPWPGNFRQLGNVLRATALMADGETQVAPGHLPEDFLAARPGAQAPSEVPLAAKPPPPPTPTSRPDTLAQSTAELIAATLARHGGNVSATARALSVSRNTVYRHLRQANQLQALSTGGKASHSPGS